MRLTIVRHARAGNKRSWEGPDELRPLDAYGEQHAKALAVVLAEYPVSRLLSSPARRCVQTLRPLADDLDLPIGIWDGLARDAHASRLAGCFAHPVFADVVVCTHGEVMRQLFARLRRDETVLADGGPFDRDRLLTKGTAWRVTVSRDGRVVELRHIAPVV